jgi:phage terminase large subunit
MQIRLQIPEAFQFLEKPKRYKVAYGGRGGAKSHAIARILLGMGMSKKLRIVCAREIQKSIKDSVHTLLADLILNNKLSGFYRITENTISGINGTEFKFRGLKHNTTDLKSLEGADILWVEEAENVSNASWEIIIPTIRKEGSEIWVSMNVKNVTDPTYQRFIATKDDDIIAVKISWRDNPWFPEVLRKEMLRLKQSDYDAYMHVWEGEPDNRRSGAVLARAIAAARSTNRIATVPYDPSCEVFTAWDLGFADSTAIWWLQFVGRELRWLEYYENSGEPLEHYAKVIKSKPYNYMVKGHFLPHDGKSDTILAPSALKQLGTMGVACQAFPSAPDVTDSIRLLNDMIGQSAFDAVKCKDGIFNLENYSYEWDDDRKVFSTKPVHNQFSHGADAARYAAVAANKIKSIKPIEKKPPIVGNYSQQSWMG